MQLLDKSGRFAIIALLGSGATADVYKAQHIIMDRIVALKVLHANRVESPENLQRFQQEARVLSQIEHPQIVTILGFGQLEDGRPYLVMDFVEGQTLAETIAKEGAFDAQRALPLFIQIAEGMSAVHQAGILHRDLKPSNVMLSKDNEGVETAKVLDFGLVRGLSEVEAQTLTKTGLTPGTPAYMSPEQCKGRPLAVQSDIYSLGCLMYETLCGTPPFKDANPLVLMSHQVDTKVITVPGKKKLPPGLGAILLKTLQKDEANRQVSMRELADELKKCRDGELPLSFYKTGNKALMILQKATGPLFGILMLVSCCFWGLLLQSNKITEPGLDDQRAKKAAQLAKHAQSLRLLNSSTVTEICGSDQALKVQYYLDYLKHNPHALLTEKAESSSFIASVMEVEGKEEESFKYYTEAVKDYEKLLNTREGRRMEFGDRTARTAELIDLKLHIVKDPQEKEELLKANLRRVINELGTDNVRTLEAMSALAFFYGGLKRYKDEEQLLKEEVQIRSHSGSGTHDIIGLWMKPEHNNYTIGDYECLEALAVNQWRLHKKAAANKYLDNYCAAVQNPALAASEERQRPHLVTTAYDYLTFENYKKAASISDQGLRIKNETTDSINFKDSSGFRLVQMACRAYLHLKAWEKCKQRLVLALKFETGDSTMAQIKFNFCIELVQQALAMKQADLAQFAMEKANAQIYKISSQYPETLVTALYEELKVEEAQPKREPAQLQAAAKLAAEKALALDKNSLKQSSVTLSCKLGFLSNEQNLANACVSYKLPDQAIALYSDTLRRADEISLPGEVDPRLSYARVYADYLDSQNKPEQAADVRRRYHSI